MGTIREDRRAMADRHGQADRRRRRGWRDAGVALALAAGAAPANHALAQDAAPPTVVLPAAASQGLTYADLVDLTQASALIVRAVVRKEAPVEPERSPGLRPGFVRLYLEAAPVGALVGQLPPVAVVHYLADVPLAADGQPPKLKRQEVLLFAHAPTGDAANPPPGAPPAKAMDIQLVAPDAQLAWEPAVEARTAAIFQELIAPGAPPAVSGVREAIYVPGTLAGEGETQIFLAMAGGTPASISVEHAPGKPAAWSASFSEVVDPSGRPPAPDTLAWYRLACGLPPALPDGANVSEGDASRAQAAADYAAVLAGLGPCTRNRR